MNSNLKLDPDDVLLNDIESFLDSFCRVSRASYNSYEYPNKLCFDFIYNHSIDESESWRYEAASIVDYNPFTNNLREERQLRLYFGSKILFPEDFYAYPNKTKWELIKDFRSKNYLEINIKSNHIESAYMVESYFVEGFGCLTTVVNEPRIIERYTDFEQLGAIIEKFKEGITSSYNSQLAYYSEMEELKREWEDEKYYPYDD